MKIRDRKAVSFEIGRARCCNCHDVTPCSLRGQDAGVRVLENQTVRCARAHSINRQGIALRMRLSSRNVLGGNEKPGMRETCRRQSPQSQLPRCGRNDCPVHIGDPTKELQGAGDRANILGMVGLLHLELTCLAVDVHSLGRKQLQYFMSSPPMRYRQYLLRRNAVLQRPCAPGALHYSSGIDEGAIHVENHLLINPLQRNDGRHQGRLFL